MVFPEHHTSVRSPTCLASACPAIELLPGRKKDLRPKSNLALPCLCYNIDREGTRRVTECLVSVMVWFVMLVFSCRELET